ncbi:MAG TPA: hypothetical protein VK492_05250 [Chitinophagaceae bacterium]|nr:hypothetical protein [Chitinophagaceae bacterium]
MKKHFLLALLIFPAVQFLSAQMDAGDVYVLITNGEVNLGKKNNIADDWKIQDGLDYLGNNARAREGYNKTYTYDNIGVVLFESLVEKVPSGKISEVQVHFSMPEANNVVPKNGFTGKLAIENLRITSTTSIATIKEKLKGYKDTESYMEHSYRLTKDGLYIYFMYDKTDTQLLKVSVGQDKREKE